MCKAPVPGPFERGPFWCFSETALLDFLRLALWTSAFAKATARQAAALRGQVNTHSAQFFCRFTFLRGQ